MNKIKYSKAAIKDLEEIGDYIAKQLKSPKTALKTVNEIQDKINKLNDFPYIGKPLSAVVNFDTDYRFLGCGGYLAFYRSLEGEVFIDRILYGKRDYISVLFGDLPQEE
jgi:addiction module RelE/StbE family toxin